jgi:hypothetical protein
MTIEYKFTVPVDLAKKLIEKNITLDRRAVREMVSAYLKLKEAGMSPSELEHVIEFRNKLKSRGDIMERITNLQVKKNMNLTFEELTKYGPYSDMDILDEVLTYYEYFYETIPLEVINAEVNFIKEIVKEYMTPETPKNEVLVIMLVIVRRLAETKPEIIKDIFKKRWVEKYTFKQIDQVIDEYLKKL